jgi:hypothetical protein
MRMLEPNPNLPERQHLIAADVQYLARLVFDRVPDGPELTAGLRKLLEAKDCFVRAAIDAERGKR